MDIKIWTSNATKQQQLIYYDVAHPIILDVKYQNQEVINAITLSLITNVHMPRLMSPTAVFLFMRCLADLQHYFILHMPHIYDELLSVIHAPENIMTLNSFCIHLATILNIK
jgi:hypothetical protein